MTTPARLIVKFLSQVDPEVRRLWAARILAVSIIGWLACHVLLVLLHQSTFFNHVLMAISWHSITLTCIDILSTSDVKVDVAE